MFMPYVNAKDVLPHELFLEVKKWYNGVLYVPKDSEREARRKLVISLWEKKTPAGDIALITELSVRRVHQIIAQECRENAFLGCRK